MDLFDVLKKRGKSEMKLDIPPPPPIPRPVERSQPRLIIPEVSGFRQNLPPPIKTQHEIPKVPEFREKAIQKFMVPKPPQNTLQLVQSKRIAEGYVKAESFRDIMENVNEIKKKIKESDDILIRLNEIKNKEDKEFENWNIRFEDIQRKLVYIDKTFFEAK